MTKSAARKPREVHKVSGGLKIGHNLNRPTCCRFCGEHLPTYRAGFMHTSQFECHILDSEHFLCCPVERCNEKWRNIISFASHMREIHFDEFGKHLRHELKPKEMKSTVFQVALWRKTFTVLWQVMMFKKVLEVSGETTQPFLPFITCRVLNGTEMKQKVSELEMCPYPICSNAIFPHCGHEHAFETNNVDGKCYSCKNFHHFHDGETKQRVCVRESFFGQLPM